MFLLDHLKVNNTDALTASTDNIFSSLSEFTTCVSWYLWTFTSSSNLRIQISFGYFDFKGHEYLEIGDGLIKENETRLAHFSGAALPNNVTSLSNSAWMYIAANHGNISSHAVMTILAIEPTGNTSCS